MLLLPIAAACTIPKPPAVLPSVLHVNFQPSSGVSTPRGYTPDTGAAFNGTKGWQTLSGLPFDLRANARARHSSASPDVRYDTLQQMQGIPGNPITTPARWAAALRNGVYNVTVTVGDPVRFNSAYSINAQNGTPNRVVMINRFRPSSSSPWLTVTKQVRVSNGLLTLDPIGGTNTKIAFVDAVPVNWSSGSLLSRGPNDSLLGLSNSRVIFSAVRFGPAAPAQSARIYNTGKSSLTIGRMFFSGPDASQFALASGQRTSFTIAPGGSVTVPISFRPAAPTACPSTGNEYTSPNDTRSAQLQLSTNDPRRPLAHVDLAGIYACGFESTNEPLLDQIVPVLGYTTRVSTPGATPFQRRTLGPAGFLPGTDEISSRYFRAADPSQPVTLTPLARYSARDRAAGAQLTGWYLKGSNPTTPCNAACRPLFSFAPDGQFNYVQNQKLLPSVNGTTSFRPSGPFGLFSGNGKEVNFSDDALNAAYTYAGTVASPVRYLHDLKVYPALRAGRARVANTYLVSLDISRVPAAKNYDSQDAVFVLHNVVPS